MRILKYLQDQYRSLRREKSILLRSGGFVLGVVDEPSRSRKSGLSQSDYLVASGGLQLPNGDIDYPIDPELKRSLNRDRLPSAYKDAVLHQLQLFSQELDGCLSEAAGDAAHEKIHTAAFDVLKRLALQSRALEHPQQNDDAGSPDA